MIEELLTLLEPLLARTAASVVSKVTTAASSVTPATGSAVATAASSLPNSHAAARSLAHILLSLNPSLLISYSNSLKGKCSELQSSVLSGDALSESISVFSSKYPQYAPVVDFVFSILNGEPLSLDSVSKLPIFKEASPLFQHCGYILLSMASLFAASHHGRINVDALKVRTRFLLVKTLVHYTFSVLIKPQEIHEMVTAVSNAVASCSHIPSKTAALAASAASAVSVAAADPNSQKVICDFILFALDFCEHFNVSSTVRTIALSHRAVSIRSLRDLVQRALSFCETPFGQQILSLTGLPSAATLNLLRGVFFVITVADDKVAIIRIVTEIPANPDSLTPAQNSLIQFLASLTGKQELASNLAQIWKVMFRILRYAQSVDDYPLVLREVLMLIVPQHKQHIEQAVAILSAVMPYLSRISLSALASTDLPKVSNIKAPSSDEVLSGLTKALEFVDQSSKHLPPQAKQFLHDLGVSFDFDVFSLFLSLALDLLGKRIEPGISKFAEIIQKLEIPNREHILLFSELALAVHRRDLLPIMQTVTPLCQMLGLPQQAELLVQFIVFLLRNWRTIQEGARQASTALVKVSNLASSVASRAASPSGITDAEMDAAAATVVNAVQSTGNLIAQNENSIKEFGRAFNMDAQFLDAIIGIAKGDLTRIIPFCSRFGTSLDPEKLKAFVNLMQKISTISQASALSSITSGGFSSALSSTRAALSGLTAEVTGSSSTPSPSDIRAKIGNLSNAGLLLYIFLFSSFLLMYLPFFLLFAELFRQFDTGLSVCADSHCLHSSFPLSLIFLVSGCCFLRPKRLS